MPFDRLPKETLPYVTWTEFADLFRYVTLRFTAKGHPFGKKIPYSFAGAVRGIWGHSLKNMQDNDCTASPLMRPSAYHVFFQIPDILSKRYGAFPTPYVFYVHALDAYHIRIELTLFGMACDWYKDAYIGLCALFKNTLRVDKVHFQLRVLDETVAEQVFIPSADKIKQTAHLEFLSPFCLKRNHAMAGDFNGILSSLAYRLDIMAFYHGLNIGENHHIAYDKARNVPYYYNTNIVAWQRHSRRRPNAPYHMVAHKGTISFAESLPDPFHLLLQLGEITHIGSYTNFGLGKYRLI